MVGPDRNSLHKVANRIFRSINGNCDRSAGEVKKSASMSTLERSLNRHVLHGLEIHDYSTVTKNMACDQSGLTAPRESWKASEEVRIARDKGLSFTALGGLMKFSHLVETTGARLALDCPRQVTTQAINRPIANAKTVITFNAAGSNVTCASFVIGADS